MWMWLPPSFFSSIRWKMMEIFFFSFFFGIAGKKEAAVLPCAPKIKFVNFVSVLEHLKSTQVSRKAVYECLQKCAQTSFIKIKTFARIYCARILLFATRSPENNCSCNLQSTCVEVPLFHFDSPILSWLLFFHPHRFCFCWCYRCHFSPSLSHSLFLCTMAFSFIRLHLKPTSTWFVSGRFWIEKQAHTAHLFSATIKHNAYTLFSSEFSIFLSPQPLPFSLSLSHIETWAFLWQLLVFYFCLYDFFLFFFAKFNL